MFTKEQVEVISKYYAASDTGLLGILVPKPTTVKEINSAYNTISYEYEQNTGEDLSEELKMWKDDFEESGDYYTNLKRVKKDIPFVLE